MTKYDQSGYSLKAERKAYKLLEKLKDGERVKLN